MNRLWSFWNTSTTEQTFSQILADHRETIPFKVPFKHKKVFWWTDSLLFLRLWPPSLSSSLSLISLVRIRMILLTLAIPVVQAFNPTTAFHDKKVSSLAICSPQSQLSACKLSFLPLTVLNFSCLSFYPLLLFLSLGSNSAPDYPSLPPPLVLLIP